MPSVTMKPFSRPFTISTPLIRPIAAPTASRMTSPRYGLSCRPLPNALTGRISQAATIGARPNVDSRDRSMPPIIRIRLSPTTTTPRAEICCPIPAMFVTVRKAGLTIVPTTSSKTSTGSSATSRSRPTFMPRRRLRMASPRARDRARAWPGRGRR